jgi:hypothetical protein
MTIADSEKQQAHHPGWQMKSTDGAGYIRTVVPCFFAICKKAITSLWKE